MADDINPTQLMLLAQQLKQAFDQDPQKHTELRVALHCAYYAAFHFTKSCLKHYVYRKNTPTHTDLYDYLRNKSRNSAETDYTECFMKLRAEQLRLLKKARVCADYKETSCRKYATKIEEAQLYISEWQTESSKVHAA